MRPFSFHSAPGFRPDRRAFTLIELLCVIAIIAMLVTMLAPALGQVRQRADSITCSANLRAIGAATQLYLQDHNFIFPAIETDPNNNPVYPAGMTPPPQTMVQAFGPYGITDKTMQCPADIKSPNGGSYALYGTSYDWKPTLDDENTHSPLIYGRRMQFVAKLAKVRQVFDDTPIHFGHMNALYADGHVVFFTQ